MAWNDPVYGDRLTSPPAKRSALDLGSFDEAAATSDRRVDDINQRAGEVRQQLETGRRQAQQSTGSRWRDAEFAYDENTGDFYIMGDTGELQNVGQKPSTLFALADTKLRKIPGGLIPKGARPVTKQVFDEMLASAPPESDFFGEAGSSLQSTIGLGASAIDAMFGDDDPSNAWSNAKQAYRDNQTLGQYKASEAPWWTPSGFASGLGETVGNIGGSALMAAPALAAGAATGGPGGAVASTGFALSGALGAAGDQATSFYANAMAEMETMTESELMSESPVYRQARAQGMEDSAARQHVAAVGARASMLPAAIPGAIEGIIGARLGAGILRRLTKGAVGSAGGSLYKGVVRRALGATAAGVGAGAGEMAESMLGQSAGAGATGIGSTNPLDYASMREFEAASQGGFLLGFLGGGGGDYARADIGAALDNAGRQSPNDATGTALLPTQPPAGPAARPPGPSGRFLSGTVANPEDDIIDGEFRDITPQVPQLAAPDDIDQQEIDQQRAERNRGEALAAFQQITGISTPQELQARMPDLLDLADEDPNFRGIMVTAGLMPNMIEPTGSSVAAGASEAAQQFALAPREPGAPPVVGNQIPMPEGATGAINLGSRVRGPASAQRAAVSMTVPEQVASPEPLAAPAERTPDGRPVGVSPPALVNPEPMDPEQARQAAQTRAQRRRAAGAPVEPVEPQTGAPAAPVSPAAVTPSTPEPAGDIEAQIEALLDPETQREAVFVAEGNEAAIPADLPSFAPEVIVATRAGRGTLLTTDPALANKFKRGKWTDADTAAVLGYSENKTGDNVGGVVMQARSPEGNIEAQQLATDLPTNKRAAAAAVARQARKGATVEETTPDAAQAERAARAAELPTNKRAAQVVERKAARKEAEKTARQSKKKSAEPAGEAPSEAAPVARAKRKPTTQERLAKKGLEVADDVEMAKVDRDAYETQTLSERATAMAVVQPAAVDAPAANATLLAKDVSLQARSIPVTGQRPIVVPASLVVEAGVDGGPINLLVHSPSPALAAELARSDHAGKMTKGNHDDLQAIRLRFEQLNLKLDGEVDAAEQRLLDMLDNEPDGPSLLEAGRARRLRAELAKRAKNRTRGRKPHRPKESPLLFVPLTAREVLTFGRKVRAQAKLELQNRVDVAKSAFRRVVGQLFPEFGDVENPTTLDEIRLYVSQLTDEEIDGISRLRVGRNGLQDSLLAKQVMRGATQVARVYSEKVYASRMTKEEADAALAEANAKAVEMGEAPPPPLTIVDRVDPAQLGYAALKGRRVTSFDGDQTLLDSAVKTVEGWIDLLERKGTKVDGEVQVMSVDAAHALYPDRFPDSSVTGRYAALLDSEGKLVHVIAVNFDMLDEPTATHVLAHEFGEFAGRQMFNRADQKTQDAVMASHAAWLQANGHLSPVELLRARAPALIKTLVGERTSVSMKYASEFSEWLADNVAKYMLGKPKPRSIVEKFFSRVAEFLRDIWSRHGEAPDGAVEAMVDAWVAGRAGAVQPGTHRILTNEGNLEDLGKGKSTLGARTAKAINDKLQSGISDAKETWQDILDQNPKDFREHSELVAKTLFEQITTGKYGEKLRFIGMSLSSLDQLVSRFRNTPVGKPLAAWASLKRRSSQLANIALQGGDFEILGQKVSFKGAQNALDRAMKLTPAVRDQLKVLMHDTTRFGIDPELAFEKHTWLLQRDGRPLSADAVNINRERYNAVMERWRSLEAADIEATKVYKELREAFKDLYDKTLAQRIANIEASDLSEAAKKDGIERIKAAHREHSQGPYFPLVRQGRWIVSATLPTIVKSDLKDKSAADQMARDQRAKYPGATIKVERHDDGTYEVQTTPRMVQFFQSEREATKAREAMFEQLKTEFVMEGTTIDEAAQALRDAGVMKEGQSVIDYFVSNARPKSAKFDDVGSSSAFVSELRARIKDAKDGSMDPAVAKALEEAYIEAMPEFSPRASLLPRQNVLGAQEDMLQAYAIRYHGAANMFARAVYGADINNAFNEIRNLKDTYSPAATLAEVLYRNEKAIEAQHEDTASNFFQRTLLHFTSFSFLAFSPAYLLMNSLQPTMVTLPMLAGLQTAKGTLGALKASDYLRDAYDSMLPFFSARALSNFRNELLRIRGEKSNQMGAHDLAVKMIDRLGKTEPEREMLRELLNSGTLDFAFLDTIDDAMRGGGGEKMLASVTRLGMVLPQQVETMNRVVTALATYRIHLKEQSGITAKSDPQDVAEAHARGIQMAAEMVRNTQIDYSTLNRPLAFNLPWLRVAAQFKMFVQGMYGLLAQNVARATIGRITEEQAYQLEQADPSKRDAMRKEFERQNKRQGRVSLMYLFATHGAMGGVMGLGPIAAAAKFGVAATAMAFGDEDDEWKSSEQLLHEAINGIAGERAGRVLREGITGGILGIPLADRSGFPNLVDTRFTGVRAGDDGATQLDKWVLYMAGGAAYANARRLAKGVGAATDGDPYTYASDAAPAAVRAVFRGLRNHADGITDADGDVLIPREQLGWGSTLITALGLPTIQQKEMYDDRREVKGTVARYRAERDRLVKVYRTADRGDLADVRKEIAEFNAAVPTAFRIKPQTLQRSLAAKRERDAGKINKDEQQVRELLGR